MGRGNTGNHDLRSHNPEGEGIPWVKEGMYFPRGVTGEPYCEGEARTEITSFVPKKLVAARVPSVAYFHEELVPDTHLP